MEEKPLIFISHIAEEAPLAKLFRDKIEQNFLTMVDAFVSSDANSIRLGINWISEITRGLRTSKAMLVLCSPKSITRPWILFESGAGLRRGIEVVPICHSGLRPVELPPPLNLLQGIEAHDPKNIIDLFKLIADKLGSTTPAVDVNTLAGEILEFEKTNIQKVDDRRPDPNALKIVTGQGGNYEKVETYSNSISRTLLVGVSNTDVRCFISNCEIHLEIPEDGGKKRYLLEKGFTLSPGKEKLVPVVYHFEYTKPPENTVHRIIFSVPIVGGYYGVAQPWLPIGTHFLVLRVTATETKPSEITCKIWVDEQGRLRLEKA
jgi:hypothetical protein